VGSQAKIDPVAAAVLTRRKGQSIAEIGQLGEIKFRTRMNWNARA